MIAIVWTLIATLLAFTVTVLTFDAQGLQVQPELITGFFLAVTGELATMGGIKIFKVKHPKDEKQEDGANND